jgi:asparagine synthase (glutamine-hydrolysing)
MCGIAGYWRAGKPPDGATLKAMTDAIRTRGPDADGQWLDATNGVALGHRRLAILDLTPAGAQPMMSHCGRYVIAFNGEVYNFAALRNELERADVALAWRGHSDTEVMLAAIAAWGLEAALKKFVGMFAFALWDRETRTLSLARDRLGEKPLYYGWQGETLLFGSELKALKAHPAFNATIDRNALTLYLRHNVIPAPYSIYQGIHKLPPGTFLQLHTGQKDAQPVAYWSARHVAETGQRNLFRGSDAEAVAELERLLSQAVGGQMVADVPLGAFLSGGIDSTTIVALMQAQSPRPIKTFTIGFNEAGYNEAEHAHAVARHLGTEHTELYVTPQDAMDVIPRLATMYDEPFADSSQIPTFLVSQLARSHVTVSLSGDGGDELFGGYNRYVWGRNIWRRIGWMPSGLRKLAAHAIPGLSPQTWDKLFHLAGPILPTSLRVRLPGDKLHKLAGILDAATQEEIYRRLVSIWPQPTDVVIQGHEPDTALTRTHAMPLLDDFTQRMMYLDQVSYLPDDILVKVDRAAMGVSLETRVPLLDHRVVEFAWQLPLSLKIRAGQGKWPLRQVLYKYVPQALVERPKMGFGVPLDVWLRGPLKDWAENLLDEARLQRECYFNPAPIREKWQEHLSGKRNWQPHLWTILMFQAWLEQQLA